MDSSIERAIHLTEILAHNYTLPEVIEKAYGPVKKMVDVK